MPIHEKYLVDLEHSKKSKIPVSTLAVWGEIKGDIENQLDLQEALTNLSNEISNEANARDQQITEAINQEAEDRQQQINDLNTQIQETNNVLAGVHTTSLSGSLLTRVINGLTPVAKNLFDINTVFMSGKTLIHDENGTIGVYIDDIDSATIEVETMSISPISTTEPSLLGTVATNADLPQTLTDAETLGWQTPKVDDYATVLADETKGGQRVEWYITAIDGSGNITWSNPVVINTGDYQAQTTAQDAGKVLTGGATPGTFGQSLGIDITPTENSNNLITSGGVYAYVNETLGDIATILAGI